MQIASIEFILFFTLVLIGFHTLSPKVRCVFLLAASYIFYGSQDIAYLCILIFATIFTYGSALFLQKRKENRDFTKLILIITIAVNCLILGYFKYVDFFTGGKVQSLLLPVGISFYLFMSIGYIVDVYQGKVEAEKNIIQYSLFVSFFPIILSGPIERAGNMLKQFKADFLGNVRFDTDRIRDGLVRMLWGYFQKLVLADRIAVLVNTVYASPERYGGAVIIVASVFYTFQIYLDFAGYSNIAIGMSEALGIKIMKNFRVPYLATSIADFWRRWHISLSSWFRDYVYIPLGGNRKGTIRKYVNVMVVFLLSGLWHGAGWTYILWGGLHGAYQVVGALLMPIRKKAAKIMCLKEDSLGNRVIKTAFTFGLVNAAWVLFRAESIAHVMQLVKRLKEMQIWELFDGTLYSLGLDRANINLLFIGLLLVVLVDILNEKGCYVASRIAQERLWIRWPIYIVGILVVLICGMWGAGYDAGSFIYYKF